MSANAVADYLLLKVDADAGDTISNLKLQKVMYYCQGWHLASFGMPVFTEALEAWEHGPVVRPVYFRFRHFGAMSITSDLVRTNPADDLSDESRSLIDDVWEMYGREFAWTLRDRTHEEPAWKRAWAVGENTVLDLMVMRDFFLGEQRRLAKFGPLADSSLAWAQSVAAQ